MILLSAEFSTKLGTIKTWLESDSEITDRDRNFIFTKGHKVTLQTLDDFNDWLLPHIECELGIGYRWFIEKTHDLPENLILFCQLIDPSPDLSWDYESGECLDSVGIENKTHRLHIGTEDAEMMLHRATTDNYMPQRFEKILVFFSTQGTFTEYIAILKVVKYSNNNEHTNYEYLFL